MAIEANIGLVHGGGIFPAQAGYVLRPGSIERTQTAIRLFHGGLVEKLVFTGGNAHGHNLGISEASMMADIAVQQGVPARQIDCENESTSTIGNWANSLPLLETMNGEAVVGITGRIASHRASMIGTRIMDWYGATMELVGYVPSAEHEGVRAYPRELISSQMARYCLRAAQHQAVPASQLDEFYLGWKRQTGLAHLKARLTRR